MWEQLDRLTGKRIAKPAKKRTKRKSPKAKVDHRIYPWTPRHTIYMQCAVCIAAPRWLNITGTKGDYKVPWLSQVGIKVLDFKYGAIMSDGKFKGPDGLRLWRYEEGKEYATAQWIELTVRGDNGVPKWAEMCCVKYHQDGGKAHYIKPKGGMIDPNNVRYAHNADGVPMPIQIRQKDCKGPPPTEGDMFMRSAPR